MQSALSAGDTRKNLDELLPFLRQRIAEKGAWRRCDFISVGKFGGNRTPRPFAAYCDIKPP